MNYKNTEFSFILIKPDSLEKNILNLILKKIINNNLNIYEINTIILNKNDIKTMWPIFDNNLSYTLLNDYLADQPLIILKINGKDAINKCLKLKYKIRNKFGKGRFSNCLHSPSNLKEYINQIKIINHSEIYSEYTSKHIYSEFWKEINTRPETSKLSYSIILKNDENIIINKVFNSLVAILPNKTETEIYILLLKVEKFGKIEILSTNNIKQAIKNYFEIKKKGIKVDFKININKLLWKRI